MRKRFGVLLAIVGFLVVVGPASAQYVQFGAGIPTSDYGDYADTGWLLAGGWQFIDAGPVTLGPEVLYGSNGHTGSDDKTNLFGANAVVELGFGEDNPVSPFIFGTLGWLSHKFSPDTGDSDTGSGISFGGGAGIGLAVGLYVEGRFLTASIDDLTTAIFAISLGWGFG